MWPLYTCIASNRPQLFANRTIRLPQIAVDLNASVNTAI